MAMQIRQTVRATPLRSMIKSIKRCMRSSLKSAYRPNSAIVSLRPDGRALGNVLISFIIDPFLANSEEEISKNHQHDWESFQMARTFVNFGYAVDIISFQNDTFVPKKKYCFFVAARKNMQRLGPLLNKDCTKIAHLDIAHILFHNAAEAQRLLALKERRGVTLRPRRFNMPSFDLEYSDCATVNGNEWVKSTFAYAKKPLYSIPSSSPISYCPDGKNFEDCRRRYLFLSSQGMVHKGLDLVLEAFAAMPEYHVTLCAPVGKETDFVEAYSHELYSVPNIETIGWVDISSEQFLTIARHCVALIYPSCSEGQAGSVVTALTAGLIPIASYQSGVDIKPEFGVTLRMCSIEEIQESVRRISSLAEEELKRMARRAWEFGTTNHSRERMAKEYRKVIGKLIQARRGDGMSTEQETHSHFSGLMLSRHLGLKQNLRNR